jgi:hypothetical protein
MERWWKEGSHSDDTECQVFVRLSLSFHVKPWESEIRRKEVAFGNGVCYRCDQKGCTNMCRLAFVTGVIRRGLQTCRILWSNMTIC